MVRGGEIQNISKFLTEPSTSTNILSSPSPRREMVVRSARLSEWSAVYNLMHVLTSIRKDLRLMARTGKSININIGRRQMISPPKPKLRREDLEEREFE